MVTALSSDGSTPYSADIWPQRAYGLAVLGALVALAVYHIADVGTSRWSEDAGRIALASFFSTASIAFAYVVERGRIKGSLAFAVVAGLVVASVLYWSGDFTSWEPWRLVSALLTVAIAAPLFQAWRDGGEQRWHIPYIATHDRAWTNVCLWFASWAFVGITFALVFLLAALFDLIGIHALRDLLEEGWFAMMLAGAALGGAIGLLRDRERIVGILQRVVMMVLSVLAPVLAIGLALFLVALPFTGLDALWDSTEATTPILLGCVIGALILANAVIGDRVEDESRLTPMRWSAATLALTILPLGGIAVISTHLRIGQYGYTPDRLWAQTFTLIAVAYGAAYLVALVRSRGKDWTTRIRSANLALAVGLCALAFLLSTPLISFGAISTRDQVAMLERGKVAVDKFDFAALRFDYGPAGVQALERLAKDGKTPTIRSYAAKSLKAKDRYAVAETQRKAEQARQIVVYPKGAVLPPALREHLVRYETCLNDRPCNLIYRATEGEAIVVRSYSNSVVMLRNGKWVNRDANANSSSPGDANSRNAAFAAGKVEIRPVQQRQVFIDGKPVGQPFE